MLGSLSPYLLEIIFSHSPTLKCLEIKQSPISQEKEHFGCLGNLTPSLKRLPSSIVSLKIVGSDFLEDGIFIYFYLFLFLFLFFFFIFFLFIFFIKKFYFYFKILFLFLKNNLDSIKCICKSCPDLVFLQIEGGSNIRLSKNALSPLLNLKFLRQVQIQSFSNSDFVHKEILSEKGVKVDIKNKKNLYHTITTKNSSSQITIVHKLNTPHLVNPLYKDNDFYFPSLQIQDEEDF